LVDADGGELTPDNVSAVFDGRLVYDWVHWYQRVTPPADLPQEDLFARLLESNFLATSTNLFARTDWLKRQADSLRSLKYCLDWQLFLQAAQEGSLHHIHKPLAAYRLHATNTVWFHEGRRWSYYLEVNRVAAGALAGFAAHESRNGESGVVRVLDAVASHLARNREADGLAIGLNVALGSLRLDAFAESSEEVQRGIQQLNRSAEDTRALLDRAADFASPADARKQSLRSLLGQLAKEQAQVERAGKAWLEDYAESLETRLRECWAGRTEVENEKSRLLQEVEGLRRGVAELDQRMQQVHALEDEKLRLVDERTELQRQSVRLKADVTGLRADGDALRRDRDALRTEVEATRDENVVLRSDLDVVRGQREVLEREVEGARKDAIAARSDAATARSEATVARTDAETARSDAMRADEELRQERTAHAQARSQLAAEEEAAAAVRERLAGSQRENVQLGAELAERGARLESLQATGAQLAADVASERAQKDDANRQLAATRSELSAVSANLVATEQALSSKQHEAHRLAMEKADLERARDVLLADVVRQRDEIAALRGSREYRWGNFAWNKLPLGYVTRRGKKWYRRMLDLKNRGLMWLSRMFRRSSKASGTAVVAACWQWPIYSHTFVYQEMLGFTHMGMDLKMFHWDLGDMGQLHKAFDYLKDHRVQIQPVWETHLRDRDHFEKTKPGRLRAFLERVSKATGRSVEELEKEPIVLQGCTFARMAELAGAKYLHSYFFYDQSFMVMQAAWLLDIPRGVSCYADHMLDDYPWKLVPLQVELASVVVATSARIKRELSAKSGGKYDDKILVKPNGVDGARFVAFDRPLRKQNEPFEVISISRVEPKKGLTHLVEAVALLKKQGIPVIAHVVGSKDLHSKGSAEYAEQFDRRIQELGVSDCVIQHGMMKQEDLAPILKKCRAFVAPYVELGSGDKDGIPTAMLEGLASGLAVVTTDSGSILEVVDNNVEGIVVKQRDSEAFAAALKKLIDDPELERRMGKAARARFDREFDIRVTEKRLHERVAALVAQVGKKR
jgi:glycosyltransferase involved in cell wall biosynthesis